VKVKIVISITGCEPTVNQETDFDLPEGISSAETSERAREAVRAAAAALGVHIPKFHHEAY
jgi:hypothetical protein